MQGNQRGWDSWARWAGAARAGTRVPEALRGTANAAPFHPAALLALFFLFFLLNGAAAAQISPGPLSRAHQTLSGATNCTTCHKLGAGEPTFRCLDCHTEIASRLTAKRGLHASYGIQPGSSQECARCHSEHNGEDFALVRWNPTPAAFDHRPAGWALDGKHAGLECSKCHNPEHISGGDRLNIRIRDLRRSFLGVSPNCLACHQDAHNGRLGQNCQQCHNASDWKGVTQFDHAKTRFALTGLHAPVTCQKCHTPGPDNKPRYTGIAFGKCADCHTDPHKGAFPQGCQSCHNTSGWKKVAAAALSQQFDHSKTKYPLLGKHASTGCLQCHAGGDFKKPLAFQKCASCHKPDPHHGQFAKRPDGGECASCHTVDGFKPAKFGLKEHAATAYALEGKHASVECAKCHLPKGRDTLYKLKFERCTDCHADQHLGQFAAAPYFNRCQQCHSVRAYRPSSFTLAKHKDTRFVLTGGHVAVPCADCHKENANFKPKPAVLYRFEDRSCTACHADPHQGQFRERMLQRRADGALAGCEACHSTGSWKELSRFDHSRTNFPLVGTHRAVACIDCHKPPNLERKLMNVDFRQAPTKCEDCHEDPHGGQFAQAGKITACAECHNSAKWKPALFDHDKRTTFALQGVHRNVRCAACHQLIREVEGKAVRFYKPTPKECAACHGPASDRRS